MRARQPKVCGALPREDSQAKIIKLVKMDTENLVQWNIRGLRSNYEELKLLLNRTYTPFVALQDCKLGEEQLSLLGYTRLPEKPALLIGGGKNLPRVPWFTEEYKQAILDRKRAQRKYFKHPILLNFINFKKAKAKSKFTIKQSKASSWRHNVSTINSHTSIKSVWKKI